MGRRARGAGRWGDGGRISAGQAEMPHFYPAVLAAVWAHVQVGRYLLSMVSVAALIE